MPLPSISSHNLTSPSLIVLTLVLLLGTHLHGTAGPLLKGIRYWSMLIALSAWTLLHRYGKS